MAALLPIRVLYVEDDLAINRMCSFLLRKVFAEVVTATDGEEALALIDRHVPDLLVTDVRMPVMDGLSLIRRMRDNGCHIPVIITSAAHDRGILEQAASLGVKACFDKPFNFEGLSQEIISVLQPVSEGHKTGKMAVHGEYFPNRIPDLFLSGQTADRHAGTTQLPCALAAA